MHRWLGELTRPVLTASPGTSTTFAAVRLAEVPLLPASDAPVLALVAVPGGCHGMIEIELVGGRRVRVGSNVDADALRRVVAVLDTPA